MDAFPTTIAEPCYPIKEKTIFPIYKSQMDAPYRVIRKKRTGSKRQWSFEWDESVALTEADYQTLRTFFLAHQGIAFTWTHYDTGTSYTVTFDQDELEGDFPYHGYRTCKVTLMEQ